MPSTPAPTAAGESRADLVAAYEKAETADARAEAAARIAYHDEINRTEAKNGEAAATQEGAGPQGKQGKQAPAPAGAPAPAAQAQAVNLEPLRGEIGWTERGGKMIRGGEVEGEGQFQRTGGEVVGRTKWVGKPAPTGGESGLWRNRPDPSFNEAAANRALDKYARGEPLGKREQEFIDHALKVAKGYDEEFDLDAETSRESGRLEAMADTRMASHLSQLDPADHAEALTMAELIQQAYDAGADPVDILDATFDGTTAEVVTKLQALGKRQGTKDDTDTGATPRVGEERPGGPEGRQAAGGAQGSFLPAPTTREVVDAERARRDAARDGRDATGRTDMASGRGELFAGPRPAQAQLPAGDEYTAKTKGGEFRLVDSKAPAGTDFSEFGEVRQVIAYDGDQQIGKLVYANDGTPPTVEVDEAYQRKGVATAMLKLAKQQGGVLGRPDTGVSGKGRPAYRTDAGQAFRTNADEGSVTLTKGEPARAGSLQEAAIEEAPRPSEAAIARMRRMGEDSYIREITDGRPPQDHAEKFTHKITPLPRGAKKIGSGDGFDLFKHKNLIYAGVDGQAVGYIGGDQNESELLVADEYRGKGIGTALQRAYRAADPFAPSGGMTRAGERLARRLFREWTSTGVEASRDMFTQTRGERAAPEPTAKQEPVQQDFAYPTRPDATPELVEKGDYEIKSLVERFGGSVVMDRIARSFKRTTTAKLVGQRIRTHQDAAALLAVYRNPLFETLRYVFTDNIGNVLGESAVSARMVSSSIGFPSTESADPGEGPKWVAETAKRFGATRFWLSHNHPSGNPNASSADVAFTARLNKAMNDMRAKGESAPIMEGHVVTNHKRYTYIEANGQKHLEEMPGVDQSASSIDPLRPDDTLDTGSPENRLNNPATAAAFAKGLAEQTPKDSIGIIAVDNKFIATVASTLPVAALRSKRGGALLSRLTFRAGAIANIGVATKKIYEENKGRIRSAMNSGAFIDFVVINEDGTTSNVATVIGAGKFSETLFGRAKPGKALPLAVGRKQRRFARGEGYQVYEPGDEGDGKPKPNPGVTAISKAHANQQGTYTKVAAQGVQQGTVSQPQPGGGRFAPIGEALDLAREKLQDKMLRLLRTQQAAGFTVDDTMDAYTLENLMHGKVRDQLELADRDFVLKIQRQLKNTGVSVDQFQDYLLARHAPERNARIASINKAKPDAGSGISTADAQAILAGTMAGPYSGKKLTPAVRETVAELAKTVDAMRDRTLDILVASGQIDAGLESSLRNTYKHYVPLRGIEGKDEFQDRRGTGKGLSAAGAAVRRALGRKQGSLAQNILGEMVGDLQRAIIQAGKAEATQAFLRFAVANPMPEMFTVEPVDLEWKFSKATGEAYLGVKAIAEDGDRTLLVPMKGKKVRIRFEDPRLRDAVMNMGANDMAGFVQIIGKVNRWRSAVLTRFNPAFAPVNVLRDLQFGMVAVAEEKGAAVAAQTLANYGPALKALWNDSRNPTGDASVPDRQKDMDDWAREYAEGGAKTGMVLVDDVVDLQKRLSIASTSLAQLAAQGRYTRATAEAALRAVQPLGKVIEQVNDATENALRLSVYVALRKGGTSKQQAATYAKNVTINFNRKGHYGSVINSIFLFYNASMQGTDAVLRLLRKPRVQLFLGGLAGLQFALAAAMMGDDDDDGVTDWDMVPDYVKRTSLVIPLGPLTGNGSDYFAVPMPYGFNIAPYAGGRLQQWMSLGSRPTDSSFFGDIASSVTEAFVPVPVTEGYSSMFGDMVGFAMQLAANKDDLGRPIAAEAAYSAYNVPAALEGRPDTPRAYQSASQLLAKIGGANLDKRIAPVGFLDVAPEQLEAVVGYALGGIGNIGNKSSRWWDQLESGAFERPLDTLTAAPIVSRFLGEGNEARAIADRYYGERGELMRELDVLKERVRSGEDPKEALAAAQEEVAAMRGVRLDLYKKDTDNARAGDAKMTESGAPRLKASVDSAFQFFKDAEDVTEKVNRAIRKARSPGSTNAEVLALLDLTVTPGSEEVAGLPTGYNPADEAPNRVRQRVIRALQERREAAQQRYLQRLESDRKQANGA